MYVGLNNKMPPLDDARVRQALIQAVDRKAILENIVEGLGVPARSYLSPGVFGYKDMQFDQLLPFDRTKAKALLAQAGWTPGPDGILQKGGQKLTLNWIAQRGRYPKDGEITEAVQQMWKEVGVDAKVEFREWATVFNEYNQTEFNRHNWTFGWATTNADADYSLFTLFHSKQLEARWLEPHAFLQPAASTNSWSRRVGASIRRSGRRCTVRSQDILAKDPRWLPDLQHERDHHHPGERQGLRHPPGRVQPRPLEDVDRQVTTRR